MGKRHLIFAVLAFVLASGLAIAAPDGGAPAAATIDSFATVPADAGELVSDLVRAVHGGQWRLAGGLALMGLVWLLRSGLAKHLHPWFGTDRGGVAMTLGAGILSVVVAELMAGSFSLASFVNGVSLALTAAGGFTMLRRLISPPDKKIAAPVPAPAPPATP